MRVAVTGGAGFIGSVVSEVLLRDGHEVVVFDNLHKGHREAVMKEASFVEVDLLDRSKVAAQLRLFGCHAVIHMAAHSLVGESMTAPGLYYRNNVAAGLSLLDAMLEAEVPKIVFSSTAAIYGEPLKQPIEETDAHQPSNPYGETKLAFERALRWYASAHGISATSLRYFNAAGATTLHGERHEPETHLIPLVLQTALGQRPHVTVFGTDYPTPDGTCIRDYIHVEDLARAHVLALNAMTAPGTCDAYNLGCGGRGYSVREVIDTVRRVTGRTIVVEEAGRRPGDPPVLIASSNRIERALGWVPQHQKLEDIVASAWTWMQRHEGGNAPANGERVSPLAALAAAVRARR